MQNQFFVGIDVAKSQHVAGFVSTSLLKQHRRFDACPTVIFKNDRQGFDGLIKNMQSFAALETCAVLLENTGHYHRALLQYLQEHNVRTYIIHARKKMSKQKTDKRDALLLANNLYNQIFLNIQVADEADRVRLISKPTELAAVLNSLVQHRFELIQERSKRKNKLTAICDEVFPELATIYRDPNRSTALKLREHFPTPAAMAAASLDDLIEVAGKRGRHGVDGMRRLQELARISIGTHEPGRLRGLCFEQQQLIAELHLIDQHIAILESEIEARISPTREGQILMSMPGISSVHAASIVAGIGNIDNFATPGRLKAYFGWAPKATQTGTTVDRMSLNRSCNKRMQHMFYMLVFAVITKDCEWRNLYERLVRTNCSYDSRTERYRGKNKVIGRVAGQMIAMIWYFLKRDQKLLASTPQGQPPPPPRLYDRERHAAAQRRRLAKSA